MRLIVFVIAFSGLIWNLSQAYPGQENENCRRPFSLLPVWYTACKWNCIVYGTVPYFGGNCDWGLRCCVWDRPNPVTTKPITKAPTVPVVTTKAPVVTKKPIATKAPVITKAPVTTKTPITKVSTTAKV